MATPNFLQAIVGGYEAGSQQAERSRLRDLAEQGRALTGKALGGDQNALAQLGGVDPNAYMNVSKFTREQKLAELDDIASSVVGADTPEKYAAVIQKFKARGHQFDPSEEQFSGRDALLSQAMGWKEKLAQQRDQRDYDLRKTQGDRNYGLQRDEFAETKRAHGVQEGLERDRITASSANKPPMGYRYNANGDLEFIKGGPADPNKPVPTKALRPNNDQSNAAGFYDRMANSNKIIGGLEQQGTDYWQNFARNYAPGGTSAYLMTPEFQQYDQAQRDFINAQLRKESGAAISESEFENARKQYFPQPGDKPKVIEQKARNRQIAIDAMKRTAGPALQMGPQSTVPQQQGGPEPGVTEDGYRFLGGDPADQNNWEPVQ